MDSQKRATGLTIAPRPRYATAFNDIQNFAFYPCYTKSYSKRKIPNYKKVASSDATIYE